MKELILEQFVKDFFKWVGREPTQKEIDSLNENADLYARDLKRILRMDLNDFISKNKIKNKNRRKSQWQKLQEKI